jgi:hypothetical protein
MGRCKDWDQPCCLLFWFKVSYSRVCGEKSGSSNTLLVKSSFLLVHDYEQAYVLTKASLSARNSGTSNHIWTESYESRELARYHMMCQSRLKRVLASLSIVRTWLRASCAIMLFVHSLCSHEVMLLRSDSIARHSLGGKAPDDLSHITLQFGSQ